MPRDPFSTATGRLPAKEDLHGLQSIPLRSVRGEILGVLSVMRAEPFEHCEREKRLAEVCATSAAAVVEREFARAGRCGE